MEEHTSPIKGTFPNPRTIACKDCMFRDRARVVLDGDVIYVGITRDECGIYSHKPPAVLFRNEPCPDYQRE